MLNIFNELRVFIEDCYEQINVRQYAKLQNISPPTASRLLEFYHKEGLLKKTSERRYNFYRANRENRIFIDISRIYWRISLEKSGLVDYLNKRLNYPTIVLFGSLSRAEARKESDIDLALFANIDKKLSFENYENKIKRRIQVFWFSSLKNVKNEDLRSNIVNGYTLFGLLK